MNPNPENRISPADIDLSPIHPGHAKSLAGRMVLIVCATVMALVGWAATASLEEKAVTTGRIIPAGEIRSVQHLEGGIVDEILVQNGEIVEAGAVMIRMRRASATAERDRLRARRSALLIKAARLRAELKSAKPDFSGIRTSEEDIKRNELAIFTARKESYASEVNVHKSRLKATSKRIESLQNELASMAKRRTFLVQEVDMRERLSKSGSGSRLDLIQSRAAVESISAETARINGEIAQAQESISETNTRIQELTSRYRERATSELGDTTTQLTELSEVAEGLEDKVVRLELRAPVKGIVQNISVTSAGDVLAPGEEVASLVPVDDELIADTEISPSDIGFVKPGQDVQVKINAYDSARFGAVDGVLESISATTFTREDGSSYYRGRVKLASAHVGDIEDQRLLIPGMTLSADIRTGSKTLLQYMLKPVYTNIDQSFSER